MQPIHHHNSDRWQSWEQNTALLGLEPEPSLLDATARFKWTQRLISEKQACWGVPER